MKKTDNTDMARLLKDLGNPIRLDILSYLLNGESCVCDIYDHLKIPQNLASHHLALLRKNGFIKADKQGKWVYYSLNKIKIEELIHFLNIFQFTKNKKRSKC